MEKTTTAKLRQVNEKLTRVRIYVYSNIDRFRCYYVFLFSIHADTIFLIEIFTTLGKITKI